MSLPMSLEAASAQLLDFQDFPETGLDWTVNAEAVYGQRVRAATAIFWRALSAQLGPGKKRS